MKAEKLTAARAVLRGGTRRARLGALLIAAATWLAGCEQAPVKPQDEPPPVNLSGYSKGFREGFKDGCDTARGKARRNEKRYGADAQYARGWDDGSSICARR